jgi:O-acetyl-ADP-ribose deacetylase (regulator of RNase III)
VIVITKGDILRTKAEALVNPVNCVGIMGRGLALQFKEKFPDNFLAYKAAYERGELKPGRMLVIDLNRPHSPRLVINFPTKQHWKDKSRIKDIENGLTALIEEIRIRNIKSIAIPPLGCGLGGLDWNIVRPMIKDAFKELPNIHVLLYEPTEAFGG